MIEKGKQNMKDKVKPIGGTGSVQPRNEEESNRQKYFARVTWSRCWVLDQVCFCWI